MVSRVWTSARDKNKIKKSFRKFSVHVNTSIVWTFFFLIDPIDRHAANRNLNKKMLNWLSFLEIVLWASRRYASQSKQIEYETKCSLIQNKMHVRQRWSSLVSKTSSILQCDSFVFEKDFHIQFSFSMLWILFEHKIVPLWRRLAKSEKKREREKAKNLKKRHISECFSYLFNTFAFGE